MFNQSTNQSNTTENTCRFQNTQNFVFVSVYALVFITGLILNLIALAVFLCHTKARSQTTVYMSNLAMADLLLVCTLPLRISHHWGYSPTLKVCQIAGLILLVNMYGSILLLMCISLDRCLAVCFPLSSRVREGRKKAPLVCLCVWMLTTGASLPFYLGKGSQGNMTEHLCFGGFPDFAVQTTALTSTLVVGFGMPLVIMLVCSWGLLRAISKSTAAQTPDLVNKRKIQRMVITNLVIFFFCFLPYHIMLVVLYFTENDTNRSSSCTAIFNYHYSLMIACMNATLDPLAYYFTAETFLKKVDMDALRRKLFLNNPSSDENRSRVPLNS